MDLKPVYTYNWFVADATTGEHKFQFCSAHLTLSDAEEFRKSYEGYEKSKWFYPSDSPHKTYVSNSTYELLLERENKPLIAEIYLYKI